ncbi:unnamed protein product [Prorocentrum cordatum]|uniref:alkylglycerone-phosphate synthase n=2 Tax=Prorocentrum TaxID=2944 RepID=A0ABN9RMN7_9DINO|nr:unnamed protein product [Polarella glacialis]
MKTLTALGGCVGFIRDASLRGRVEQAQEALPTRSALQFFTTVLKGCVIKLLGHPCAWGLVAALCSVRSADFDALVIGSVRGFPHAASIRQRPCRALLRLLRRRIGNQHLACVEGGGTSAAASTVARRCRTGALTASRLVEGGATVLTHGAGVNSWWLLPVLVEDPESVVRGLWARGFDATCTSTQLKRVPKSIGSGCSDIMDRIVYLPLTPELPREAAKSLADAVLHLRQAQPSEQGRAVASGAPAAGVWAALLSVVLALRPALLQWPLWPAGALVVRAAAVSLVALVAAVWLARRLAAEPGLQMAGAVLPALAPRRRSEGAAWWRGRLAIEQRIDGAVLLTGATGFVGGGILFGLLAQAEELGVTRIVLLLRRKDGQTVAGRLAQLRANVAFQEVQEQFDRLVTVIEGDTSQKNFGQSDAAGPWVQREPLRVVLHCAADVRFDQPLQQAALSLISASLQVALLAKRWGASRFLFVSTAFVHAVPAATSALQERLVELRDFDPMELYRDAVSHGKWAGKAMRDLGFPNTYTFAKAVAEHLILQACGTEGMQAHIVRPSIVTPAWASPYAGWSGDKPSTIVAAQLLLLKRCLRIFRCSAHPCPLVPVDVVACAAIQALVASAPAAGGVATIANATVDASEAAKLPSFQLLVDRFYQLLALRGDVSLPEAGLIFRLNRWAENATVFWLLDRVMNVFPNMVMAFGAQATLFAAQTVGLDSKALQKQCKAMQIIGRYSTLPAQYEPFSAPSSGWLFRSKVRLPEDWDPVEYNVLIQRAAILFAQSGGKSAPPPRSSTDGFQDICVVSSRPWWCDALAAFTMPGSPLLLSCADFMIRQVLKWMDFTVKVDAASLVSATELSQPLVLCPTHRSVLDFVIIGTACFRLCPLLPRLQVPHVAADAEFAGLPLLGGVLASLGAFYVRRGGGAVQPDPALRAEVSRVFQKGRPLEVFLEGLRSRGRRQLRLRSGLLRALRDVSQRTVALVPIALSYELLPEDTSFFDELRGCPRPPLSTSALVGWVFRGMRGELPSFGEARVRLGAAHVLDAAAELPVLLAEVQEQLVNLTSITALHARALAELLELHPAAVCAALRSGGVPVHESRLPAAAPLTEAERWPLVLQTATLLRARLPQQWARWLVEPVLERGSPDCCEPPPSARCSTVAPATTPPPRGDARRPSTAACGAQPSAAAPEAAAERGAPAVPSASEAFKVAAGGSPQLDMDVIVAALALRLEAAEDAAHNVARALQESGVDRVTEEHLLQQLLQTHGERQALPPPLARGAACIVAGRLSPGMVAGYSASREKPSAPRRIAPLWPTAPLHKEHRCDDEALDRWGFKDTRFSAQWVDGRPAMQVTSTRYGSLGGQPMHQLWALFQTELGVSMSVRGTLPEEALPALPPPSAGLVGRLAAVLAEDRICTDAEARLRACTGHGLADIWRLRTRSLPRAPDAVVRPAAEEEVASLLEAAQGDHGFAVIPVGGRTNVTSALTLPAREVDPRPQVALDMRGLNRVLWVNAEDGVAHVEAGITGSALKEALRAHGVNMGMEPDSMEFSTLGGWIATRASGMKRARYGNIEDMILEVSVATPSGVLWQHQGIAGRATARSAYGRASTNVGLPGMVLGSEGCLGVVTSAVVRVRPMPEIVEYQSVAFCDWEQGTQWMREVARLPAALRPASCRLMDNKQLQLSQAIREDGSRGQLASAVKRAILRLKGIRPEEAAAATLVFEGSQLEVVAQKSALSPLVRRAGGVWGGSSSGEAGYALTFAIAYLRDFALDHRILSESLETMAPWSVVDSVWPAVVAAVRAEHAAMWLPGQPYLTCRMTQLYDEGAVLYMYLAVSTIGLAPEKALEAFERLERAARRAVLDAGGCLSHHHGVGKLRAGLLPRTQAPAWSAALRGLKAAVDPANVLGARNGVWAEAARGEERCGAPL